MTIAATLTFPMAAFQYVSRGIQAGVDFAASELAGEPGEGLVRYVRTTDIAGLKALKSKGVFADAPLVPDSALARDGDLLLTRAGSLGTAYLHRGEPVAVAGYLVRVQLDSSCEPRFYAYYCQSQPFLDALETGATRTTIQNFSASKYAALPVPVPSLDVQRRVADMLDAETARIDTLIAKNQAASDLLSRRARETVARAVTEGATPGKVCATTLEWAPAIRDEWQVAPYQYVARIGTGHTPSRAEDAYWQDCDIPWVTTTDVKHLRPGRIEVLQETEVKISDLGLRNSAATMHPAGTVFLSRTASVGFSGIMGVDMATSQDFFTWTCGPRLLPEYLLYVLRSMKSRGQFDRMMYGSTHKTIYYDELAQLRGPLPPLDEQRQAVERIRQNLAPLYSAIDRMDDMTRLLRTRRQALITAAVTGQITV